MLKKTLSHMILVLTLCMFTIPSLGSTTVYANNTDTGAIPVIGTDLDNGTVTFGGDENFENQDKAKFWTKILTEGRGFVVGVSGIGALVAIGVFIMSFMKLGTSAGNPQARTQALTGILWSGIAAAGLGSVTLITGLFYGALK